MKIEYHDHYAPVKYEEIPDEDLHEDGELTRRQVEQKIVDGWYDGSIILMRERITNGKSEKR